MSSVVPGARKSLRAERGDRRLRVYLSSSIVNGPLNARLRTWLPSSRYELVLPQEFSPTGVPRHLYPKAIYEQCIHEMERCDFAILLLDAFGVDCACEAGWLSARGTPLIGVGVASCRFLQHWMVKGSITATVLLDPLLHDEVKRDPTLGTRPSVACNGWEEFAGALESVLDSMRVHDRPQTGMGWEGVES